MRSRAWGAVMKVRQVENVLDLLEMFARAKTPHTLTGVSAALGLPKSSTFNLIETLVDRGILYETRQRGGYYPTRKLFDLAREIMDGDMVLKRINGELQRLAAETGETAVLSVRDGDDIRYVDVVESSALIRYIVKVGERRPVYATSSGKAILSSLPEPARTKALQSLTLVAYEQTTARTVEELAAVLDESIARGWSEDLGEYTPEVMGMGVPIVHHDRRYGLAIAGPISRMQSRRLDLAETLKAAAERIHKVLED
ncbi:MAG TPA: IclR family transcriptional regulator [Methylomirabilota bacterium]|nr:IclR family transcriptional regulator [Methylomirabilota bacterium]